MGTWWTMLLWGLSGFAAAVYWFHSVWNYEGRREGVREGEGKDVKGARSSIHVCTLQLPSIPYFPVSLGLIYLAMSSFSMLR